VAAGRQYLVDLAALGMLFRDAISYRAPKFRPQRDRLTGKLPAARDILLEIDKERINAAQS